MALFSRLKASSKTKAGPRLEKVGIKGIFIYLISVGHERLLDFHFKEGRMEESMEEKRKE